MTINQTLLSQANWSTMYPKAEYKTRGKVYPMHFLLALRQPDSSIISYMAKARSVFLSKVDTENYNLTPLIIATMRNRVKVVEGLLQSWKKSGTTQSNINMQDLCGWSAAHHACLSSPQIYKMLLEHGANVKLKTRMDGTCADLKQLTERNVQSVSIKKVKFVSPEGKVSQVSEKTFGLEEWRDMPFYPKGTFEKLWQQTPDDLPQLKQAMQKMLTEYFKSPPLLTISESQNLKGRSICKLGLHADEPISCGRVIAVYSGVIEEKEVLSRFFKDSFDKSSPPKMYRLPPLDAETIGSAARFANWGWPNAVIQSVTFKGTKYKCLLASDPKGIKKGDEILWDYGIKERHLAFGSQVLFKREEMRNFFRNGLGVVVARWRSDSLKGFDTIHDQTRIQFPLNVPLALLDLHFSNIVQADEWITYMYTSTCPIFISWSNQHAFESRYVTSMITRIHEFEGFFKKEQELKKLIGGWVLDQIGQLSVMKLLKSLEMMVDCHKNFDKDPDFKSYASFKEVPISDYWNVNKSRVMKFLETYDWLEDENAPLGFERTYQDFKLNMMFSGKERTLPFIKNQLRILTKKFPDKKQEIVQKYSKFLKEVSKS